VDAALAGEADQAAQLAKTDLLTDMVGEFPELQGIMGGYYARHDGLGDGVAMPSKTTTSRALPATRCRATTRHGVVALADKLETLVGMFGIGSLPTGDKDPFALRRHALGVIRMLVEKRPAAGLPALLAGAARGFRRQDRADPHRRRADCRLHLRPPGRQPARAGLQRPGSRRRAGAAPAALGDMPKRLAAVRAFAACPKRRAGRGQQARRQHPEEGRGECGAKVTSAAAGAAEQALAPRCSEVCPQADPLFERGDYTASCRRWPVLRRRWTPSSTAVMVNAEDPACAPTAWACWPPARGDEPRGRPVAADWPLCPGA
jgi:glycyl-tRNA synthetase beta chain